jgi:hypothetical protein
MTAMESEILEYIMAGDLIMVSNAGKDVTT